MLRHGGVLPGGQFCTSLVEDLMWNAWMLKLLAKRSEALPVEYDSANPRKRLSSFVNCGEVLPGYDIEIRDAHGRLLPERQCGTLFVQGPSVRSGYFGDKASTREALTPDGWFNTGDLAYRVGDTL